MNNRKSISVTVILFCIMFIGAFGMYQLGAVPSQVYERLHLTDAQFSSIMTASMVPSIFLSIVSGSLVDRFGIRRVLGISFAVMTLGLLIRPFADGYPLMFFAMMLGGFTNMSVTGNLSKIAASLFPPEKVVGVVGVIMVGSTSAMAASYLTASLFPSLDVSFWTVAVIGTVLTIVWWLFVRDSDFRATEAAEQSSMREALSVSLHSKGVWLTGISLALMMAAATIVTNFHVVALTSVHGMTDAQAGLYGTVLTVGAVSGSFLIPIAVSGRKNLRLLTFLIGLTAAGSMFFLLSSSPVARYIASFLQGSLRSGILALLLAYPVMFKEIGPRYAGTAGGVVATLELLGAVVIPTYVVVPLCGSSYTVYFAVGGILILASSVCAFLIKFDQANS